MERLTNQMMRLTAVVLFMLSPMAMKAQYLPLLEEGKEWEICRNDNTFFCYYQRFRVQGETQVDGKACWIVETTGSMECPTEVGNSHLRVQTSQPHSQKVVLYEEDGKVWRVDYLSNFDRYDYTLLYDFDVSANDKVHGFTVLKTYVEDIMGVERKVIVFEYGLQWIEGLGNMADLLNPMNGPFDGGDSFCLPYSCKVGEKTYFQAEKLPSANQMLVDEKQWLYETSAEEKYEYYIDGDSVVNYVEGQWWATTYGLKLYRRGPATDEKAEYVGLLYYTDEKKSCSLLTPDRERRKIYHFGLNVGESDNINGHTMTLLSQDMVNLEGYEHRVFILEDEEGGLHKWIEGIGSVTDLIEDYPMTDPVEYSQYGNKRYEAVRSKLEESADSRLIRCEDNDVAVYLNRDPTGLPSVLSTGSNDSGPVYDLQGRKLPNTPVRGIYIRDGHKYLRR